MKTQQELIEAQQLIVNINMMREKIGVTKSDFNFLYSKSIDELRIIQEQTIQHYNQAIKNKLK